MSNLIYGLILWSVAHIVPISFPNLREKIVSRLGISYRVILSIVILFSMYLIVIGWQETTPVFLYALPNYVKHITMMLVLIALVLLTSVIRPTNIKRYIRYPYMWGFIIWAVAHLLANGDTRSFILFTWLILWAVITIIIMVSKNTWVKPAKATWLQEAIGLLATVVLYVVIVFTHQYFTGMPLIGLNH